MSIKGFPSLFHSLKTMFSGEQYNSEQKYATIQDLGGRGGLDTVEHGLYDVGAVAIAVDAGCTQTIIKKAAHGITRVGDVIRMTSGLAIDAQAPIIAIPDADTLILGNKLPSAPAALDEFRHYRFIGFQVDSSGGIITTNGPLQFRLDGAAQEVVEDTVTPANNAPLPVKLTSLTGDVNITAGDLNVQTSHLGVNHDSQRIGDGTNLMAVNASLEAQVRDDDANTALTSILAQATRLDIVDQLDAGVIDPSTTNIPASSVNAISVVASLASAVKKIQVIEDIGEFMAIYSDAARTSLICYLPLAGGEVEVNIAATTEIFIGAVKNSAINSDTRLMIQFMG
jgi:hypothetical protein